MIYIKYIVTKNAFVTSNPETVYLTVVDKDLNAVSFINSICHSFGSCISSNNSGILFQNRGVNFRLEKNHPNVIQGGKKTSTHNNTWIWLQTKIMKLFFLTELWVANINLLDKHMFYKIFDYNKSIQEALDFPRAFALNGKLKVEKSLNIEIIKKLRNPLVIIYLL